MNQHIVEHGGLQIMPSAYTYAALQRNGHRIAVGPVLSYEHARMRGSIRDLELGFRQRTDKDSGVEITETVLDVS